MFGSDTETIMLTISVRLVLINERGRWDEMMDFRIYESMVFEGWHGTRWLLLQGFLTQEKGSLIC